MHSITVTQFKDDDDEVITTAETDPAALSVSVCTTGAIVDVDAAVKALRPLGVEGFTELFLTCAQAAFAHRYDPLLSE